MFNEVYLLIGGNIGDRFKLLEQAKRAISKKIGEIKNESSIYETAPWGFKAEQSFLNQVVKISTKLSPQKILKFCFEIEDGLGRERKSNQYESRTMDIDILFYNDEIVNEPGLIIPHPKLHLRRFTLVPLTEIEPGFVHPVFKKTSAVLLENCNDNSKVQKL